jgi:large subunit ribosomal protein L21
MYAIVEISGKQFKVAKSDFVKVPLQNVAVKDKLQFTNVMLVDDEGKVSIGTPFVKNVEVSAHVVEHGRDRKIIVFKKKRRKDYKVKRGHRQGYTQIKIDAITVGKPKVAAAPKVAAPKKAAPKATAPKKAAAPKVAAPKKTEAAKKTEKE